MNKRNKKSHSINGDKKDQIMQQISHYQLNDVNFIIILLIFCFLKIATKRDLKLEKMKTLYKMKKMMEVNNVKDQFQYFNEEE